MPKEAGPSDLLCGLLSAVLVSTLDSSTETGNSDVELLGAHGGQDAAVTRAP